MLMFPKLLLFTGLFGT